MHDDPEEHREEHADQRRLVAAPREIGPRPRKGHAPGERKDEVYAGTDHVGDRSKRILHVLAEDEPGRIAGNARKRHQMLDADPDDGLIDPDDDAADQAAQKPDTDRLTHFPLTRSYRCSRSHFHPPILANVARVVVSGALAALLGCEAVQWKGAAPASARQARAPAAKRRSRERVVRWRWLHPNHRPRRARAG